MIPKSLSPDLIGDGAGFRKRSCANEMTDTVGVETRHRPLRREASAHPEASHFFGDDGFFARHTGCKLVEKPDRRLAARQTITGPTP